MNNSTFARPRCQVTGKLRLTAGEARQRLRRLAEEGCDPVAYRCPCGWLHVASERGLAPRSTR